MLLLFDSVNNAAKTKITMTPNQKTGKIRLRKNVPFDDNFFISYFQGRMTSNIIVLSGTAHAHQDIQSYNDPENYRCNDKNTGRKTRLGFNRF